MSYIIFIRTLDSQRKQGNERTALSKYPKSKYSKLLSGDENLNDSQKTLKQEQNYILNYFRCTKLETTLGF